MSLILNSWFEKHTTSFKLTYVNRRAYQKFNVLLGMSAYYDVWSRVVHTEWTLRKLIKKINVLSNIIFKNWKFEYWIFLMSFWKEYPISANSFCGNYHFLNLTLCSVTFGHSTYRCGNYSREQLFKGRNYSRKYGSYTESF